jgi:CheY-like chemotaxis protein
MSKQNILIIDDDQAQHEILGEHLSLSGFSALHAQSSKEGFDILNEKDVALILLDINMPETDGFETIELLRNNSQTQDTPVLFLTSLDRQYLKIKGLELGADDYVTKPYNGAELMARIKAILRRKGQTSVQQSALSGDIKEIGLGDLLQNISGSLKTGTVTFADMDGKLILSGGNIISARQGDSRGMEALLRLMLLEQGHFTVSYQDIPDIKADQGTPIMKALLSGVNEVDQIKMAVEETTGQKDPFLEIADNKTSDDPSIDKLKSSFPCRLMSLAIAMEGSLKKNIHKVLKAIHTKKLVCLSK